MWWVSPVLLYVVATATLLTEVKGGGFPINDPDPILSPDCRRSGRTCNDYSCNLADGQCLCGGGKIGAFCDEIPTTDIPQTDYFGEGVISRGEADRDNNIIHITSPAKRFTYDGTLIGWKVLLRYAARKVRMQIWRPASTSPTELTYSLVHETADYEVAASDVGNAIDYYLPESERTQVQVGDTIGFRIMANSDGGAIPFDIDSSCSQVSVFKYLRIHASVTLVLGQARTFANAEQGWNWCRLYSYQAIIQTGQITLSGLTCPSGRSAIKYADYLTLSTAPTESEVAALSHCICDSYDSDGKLCDGKRVMFECKLDSIVINRLVPQEPFTGSIYLKGKRDSCPFVPGVEWNYFSGTCIPTQITSDSGSTLYIFEMIVEYGTGIINRYDQELALECKVDNTNTGTIEATITSVSYDDSVRQDATSTDVLSENPTMSLGSTSTPDSLDNPVSSLTLGTTSYLTFQLELTAYRFFKVMGLTVSDGGSLTRTFIENGCWVADASGFVTDISITESNGFKYISVKYTVFMFSTGSTLKFVATVLMCVEDGDCELAVCTAASTVTGAGFQVGHASPEGRRRRRRDTQGDVQLISGEMNVQVEVVSPRDAQARQGDTCAPVPEQSCLTKIIFLVPLIVITLMLVIAMATAVYFCSKLRRLTSKTADTHHDYQPSDVRSNRSKYPPRY